MTPKELTPENRALEEALSPPNRSLVQSVDTDASFYVNIYHNRRCAMSEGSLNRLLDAARASRGVEGWQPIGTAPRDIPILAWKAGWGPTEAHWEYGDDEDYEGWIATHHDAEFDPTHWMALPPAPPVGVVGTTSQGDGEAHDAPQGSASATEPEGLSEGADELPLTERLIGMKAVVNLLAAGEATAPNLSAFAVCWTIDEAVSALTALPVLTSTPCQSEEES